jgi:catechol 2,3-dioxygenase-like lactoylglutathione lyase family enzyme
MKPVQQVNRSRAAISFFLALLLSAAPVPSPVAAQVAAPAVPTPLVTGVASVGMTVADMERSIEFYTKILAFEKLSDVEVAGSDFEHLQGLFGLRMRVVRLRLGSEVIELTEYLAPAGRPVPPDSRANDRWFQHIAIIVSDMDRAYQWLRQNKVRHASSGPQLLPEYIKAAAGIRAFYFRDPDDHFLEILSFPPDKGDAKWHQRTDKLFLGIDHTAIVVADTDASLRFYRDTLGFRLAGESENYGPEQEHLNNVFGARLRITAVRAASGPGIELLEYLAPRDGRPMPPDERSNDVVHWQTQVLVHDLAAAAQHVRQGRYAFISPGAVDLRDPALGFRQGLAVRDPDGHVFQLVSR